MTDTIFRSPIHHPSAWKADDVRQDSRWVHRFALEHLEEIDAALRKVQAAGLRWSEFDKQAFALPKTASLLATVDAQVRDGHGFALIKGLPVERYSLDELKTLYWGLGQHIGQVISHNVAGDFVAPVTDMGETLSDDPNRRRNTTNQFLDPHTDLADIVALLCVDTAKEGGLSSICSAVAIHNEIVQHHPEYLEPLYEGFHHDYRGYGPNGEPDEVTADPIPVFEYNNGRINCAFAREIIKSGARKRGVPLTTLQKEAVDFVHDLGTREDLRLDMMLEPGDIQLINNYTTLHSRSHYIDGDGHKRYLLRMWVNLENSVQLSPRFASFVRRGIPARTGDAVHHATPLSA